MRKIESISDAELEIMEYLWNHVSGPTLKEIWQYFEPTKGWKKQAVRSFLIRLHEKQFLNIYIDPKTNKYVYLASKTKLDYQNLLSKSFLKKYFNNSVYDFLLAFSKDDGLSEDAVNRLKEFLDA